jgi:hypothetical protein
MRKDSAFRGIWINVVKMLEVGRIFEIAESRHAVALGTLRCLDLPCFGMLRKRRCEPSRTEKERFATC